MTDQSAAESARNKQDKNSQIELDSHGGYRNMTNIFGWLLAWLLGIMFPFLQIINHRQFFGHRTKISFLNESTDIGAPKPIEEETKLILPPRKIAASKTKKIKRKFFNKPLNKLPNQSIGELN